MKAVYGRKQPLQGADQACWKLHWHFYTTSHAVMCANSKIYLYLLICNGVLIGATQFYLFLKQLYLTPALFVS